MVTAGSSMERWGNARQNLLARQERGLEEGQARLAECQQRGLAVVADEICFNQKWGGCVGELEFCTTFGFDLCGLHHNHAHVVTYDVNRPQPQDHYSRPAAQVRAALEDGLLILWCGCGEPYFPSTYTINSGDGTRQQFFCPKGHHMEVTVYWKELDPVAASNKSATAVAAS